MNTFYLTKMEEVEADGIDFIPFGFKNEKFPKVIASYTKEELKTKDTLPRTGYKFWKLINGKKIYIVC